MNNNAYLVWVQQQRCVLFSTQSPLADTYSLWRDDDARACLQARISRDYEDYTNPQLVLNDYSAGVRKE
jgi:hypothetical protein